MDRSNFHDPRSNRSVPNRITFLFRSPLGSEFGMRFHRSPARPGSLFNSRLERTVLEGIAIEYPWNTFKSQVGTIE